MPRTASFRPFLLALGVLMAIDAAALTLGRPRGAVLIGRPLELSIPATLDASDGETPCVEGDVFYGEQRIEQRLNIRFLPTDGRQASVRVTSATQVDEPMVTLYLRVGCVQKVTRRYVLLAELPPEQEPAVPLVTLPRMGGAIVEPRPGTPASQLVRPTPPVDAARSPSGPAAVAGEPSPRLAPARRLESTSGARPAAGRSRPRLRLESLDLPERDASLRPTPALQAVAPADDRTREAAAALWAAISKPPEAAASESLRLKGLESELQALREMTRQNAVAVTLMREQAEKAREERNFVTWIGLGLLALLLLAMVLLAWQWRRGGVHGKRWYAGAEADSGLQPVAPTPAPAAAAASAPVVSVARLPAAPEAPDDEVRAPPSARKSQYGALSATDDRTVAFTRPVRGTDADFQPSMGGSIRMVRVDELIDIQDKANFFLSIGQHEQAVAVLEGHVHDQVETSALAWLDLLELYHSLGRRQEFERLRAEFRQQFNANVPEFDAFNEPTGGLEKYGRALSRIVALWPSPRVLEVIEESIFRRPGVAGAEAFSLEAYRELILLYNMARDIVPEHDMLEEVREGEGTQFPGTDLQPLAPWTRLEEAQQEQEEQVRWAERDALYLPPASPRLGLDIDLDEPVASSGDATLPLLPAGGAAPAAEGSSEPSYLGMLDFDTSFGEIQPAKKPSRR